MKKINMSRLLPCITLLAAAVGGGVPGEAVGQTRVASPDGRIAVTVTDQGGLRYAVSVEGQPVVSPSVLGLRFNGGAVLGPGAKIDGSKETRIDRTWENRFGTQRTVRDRCNETYITIKEGQRTFGLVVRVYDDGVAFRYHIPEASGLGSFVLAEELTEFEFAEDARCWAGEPSVCAENQYREHRLSTIPVTAGRRQGGGVGGGGGGPPYLSVVPLLVETSRGFVSVAESDVRDWPAMFLQPTGTTRVKVNLPRRADGNGLVASNAPRFSPWRSMMITRDAAGLMTSELIANLATPSVLADTSWVEPGVSAWDPWWTGRNPNFPQTGNFTGVNSRGDTKANKQYIDLAASMGWRYQLIDWMWYVNMTSYDKMLHSTPNANLADFTRTIPEIDVPELVRYAKEKNVKLLIWAHCLDLKTFGEEKALAHLASLGVAGVKIDFISSQTQESAQWCEKVVKLAAEHKLLVNFHGAYHPTGLNRTYPNFITQEGVLGNEYNKLPGRRNDPAHQLMLPFTRATLGPMDYTPGGFLNRTVEDFRITVPAEVMGTRARELALTVLYPSPLLVMCDAPENYLGQPGLDFLRSLPTVWDEVVVLAAEVGKQVCVARRSGDRWYVVALTLDARELDVPLSFLSAGQYKIRRFADDTSSGRPNTVIEDSSTLNRDGRLKAAMAVHGGFAAILELAR